MKRRDLVRHLNAHGCALLREGGIHSVYVNRTAGKATAVPRHREINEHLAREICRDLQVPEPRAQDPANGMMGLDENGVDWMPVGNTGGAAIAPPASSFATQSSR